MRKDSGDKIFFGLVLFVSVLSFVIALRISNFSKITVESNDSYQYIEAGNNIFRDLDFTVRHQTGELVAWPPAFPVLIHLLAFLNKNPALSIKLLIAFSISFSIIPLYLFAKSAFNRYIGLLASVLFPFFAGIVRAPYQMSSHYFLALPVVTIFWLTWKIMSEPFVSPVLISIDGLLFSAAVLTQSSTLIYLAVIIFFLFLSKNALKKISYFLLGFLPCILLYAVIIFPLDHDKITYSNTARSFLGGNYLATKGISRDKMFYELNAEGTEFKYLNELKAISVVSYCISHPQFMIRKYGKGFIEMVNILKNKFNPFQNRLGRIFAVTIPAMLLMLALLGMLPFRLGAGAPYVLAWLMPSFLIPLVLVKYDYLFSYLPFYIMLLTAGGSNLYNFLRRKAYVKVILLGVYIIFLFGFIFFDINFYKNTPSVEEYEKAASWVKNDAQARGRRVTIMSRKTIYSSLADANYIAIPYEESWERVKKFALLKKVDYIVLDNKFYWGLLPPTPVVEGIKAVYQSSSSNSDKVTIYKLL